MARFWEQGGYSDDFREKQLEASNMSIRANANLLKDGRTTD